MSTRIGRRRPQGSPLAGNPAAAHSVRRRVRRRSRTKVAATRIRYLDGRRLRRALLAACEHAQLHRAELNRINVFPVPDGDTGTNLALTVRSIADRLRRLDSRSAATVAREAAEAGIIGARGNCGMILAHFLQGFARSVASRAVLGTAEFAAALRDAVSYVYSALDHPVEGTIVTVMDDAATAAVRTPTSDFAELLDGMLARARESLARTTERLPALREAGVVDAGAKGFVSLIEGIATLLHGKPPAESEHAPESDDPPAAARVQLSATAEKYRFCTEALVRGPQLPDAAAVRAALQSFGDSLIVLRSEDVLKVHIHTDAPEQIFDRLRAYGTLVAHKAEDMAAQHASIERAAASHVAMARRPVVVVTDSSCDLPDETIRAHGIHVVPLSLIYNDEVLRDRVDIDAATFVQRLRNGERATTSQPPPAAFIDAYRQAAEDGEAIVALTVGSTLSGTFTSAEAAARLATEAPVHLVDSRGISLNLGLLTLRAAELAELGTPPEEIVAELNRIRERSGLFFTVDNFDGLVASGRVGAVRAWLGGLLHLKPILELDVSGRVRPVAKARGRNQVLPLVMRLLESRIPKGARRVRFGIVHVGCEEVLETVARAIRDRFGPCEIITGPVCPVIATHVGIGAWGLAYQVED